MEQENNTEKAKQFNRTDHFANERTFLAWTRTSLGIMAFGFVIDKFALLMKHINTFMIQEGFSAINPKEEPVMQNFSSLIGIILMSIGTLLCLFSFIRFKKMEKQINESSYYSTALLDTLLTTAVISIGIFLILYTYFSL